MYGSEVKTPFPGGSGGFGRPLKGRIKVRQRLSLELPEGGKLDMIADSYFVQLMHDLDLAMVHGDPFIDNVCNGLGHHPHYVRAFEYLLEREGDPERRMMIERILLEYELLSAFCLLESEKDRL